MEIDEVSPLPGLQEGEALEAQLVKRPRNEENGIPRSPSVPIKSAMSSGFMRSVLKGVLKFQCWTVFFLLEQKPCLSSQDQICLFSSLVLNYTLGLNLSSPVIDIYLVFLPVIDIYLVFMQFSSNAQSQTMHSPGRLVLELSHRYVYAL